jgi:fructose-1-phosphate kinase PfkB-like protein
LKINAGELKKLSGEDTVSAGMQNLFATYSNLCFCAVTDGPASSFASDGKQLMQYDIPVLKNVINPIGCGDTASAAFSGELASGTEPFEAFRRALGCASANCLTPQPGDFSPEAAQQIISKITIKTI